MRHTLLYITLVTLLAASCSGGKKSFSLSGKFKGLDQSAFVCYSASPAWGTLDTIKVERGSFSLQHDLSDTVILTLQYPNFMRTEVVAIPGGSVKVKGDANNMLNIRVSGDKENDDLTQFRRSIVNKKDEALLSAADAFIRDNPGSWASVAILNRYFLQAEHPDYPRISRLLSLMLKVRPQRHILRLYQSQLAPLLKYGKGARLPSFTTKDLNGVAVSNKTFQGSPLLITFWAPFSPENLTLLREQRRILKSVSPAVKTLNISLDADSSASQRIVRMDSIAGYNVCDCLCFNSPLVLKMGVRQLPANILVDARGIIRARDISAADLPKELAKIGVK